MDKRDSSLHRRLQIFLSIVEIKTKVISVVTFASAVLFSIHYAEGISPLLFILMTLAVLLVDMGTTAFNNYFDFRSGVDVPEFSKDRDKILMLGDTSAFTALHIAVVLFLAAVIVGLVITFLVGLWVAVAGAVSMAVGYLYNGGPHPISRTPFGELFAGGFLGGVLFLISVYVFTGGISPAAVFAAIPPTLLVGGVLLVNNTCDMVGDKAAGRKTLPLVVGKTAGELGVYAAGAAAYAVLLHSVRAEYLPETVIYGAVPAAAITFYTYLRMHRRGYNHDTKVDNMKAIVGLYGLYGIMFTGTLGADVLFR